MVYVQMSTIPIQEFECFRSLKFSFFSVSFQYPTLGFGTVIYPCYTLMDIKKKLNGIQVQLPMNVKKDFDGFQRANVTECRLRSV